MIITRFYYSIYLCIVYLLVKSAYIAQLLNMTFLRLLLGFIASDGTGMIDIVPLTSKYICTSIIT